MAKMYLRNGGKKKSIALVHDGWYVFAGCTLVNHTCDEIKDGMDACDLHDDDCFTWDKPIHTTKELIKAINS